MNTPVLLATVEVAGVTISGAGVVAALSLLILVFIALLLFWVREVDKPLRLHRLGKNPILSPRPDVWWESEAVFNPAAVVDNGRVHLLYRAMGSDGISRIGYASSRDGIHFDERHQDPMYAPTRDFGIPERKRIYGPLSYSTRHYASGGGWGGCEDPRAVKIDGHLHMTFVAFDGWGFVRMALNSLMLDHFREKKWNWKTPRFLSPEGEIHKNWILFPEKIRGKYAVLHSISPPEISIEYVDSLDVFDGKTFIQSRYNRNGRAGFWDASMRGAGAPPIKTSEGWLLFYHGMNPAEPHIGYKVGAMLLDLEDPTKILFRSKEPVLEPTTWYENEWKQGVVMATGAVVLGNDLIVYYGGGDKYIAAAKADLRDFLRKLTSDEHATLTPVVK
jgi:beta-1,2-mannobiose phosphorylase / 1,2-beta-oligomannan phosphorylase